MKIVTAEQKADPVLCPVAQNARKVNIIRVTALSDQVLIGLKRALEKLGSNPYWGPDGLDCWYCDYRVAM